MDGEGGDTLSVRVEHLRMKDALRRRDDDVIAAESSEAGPEPVRGRPRRNAIIEPPLQRGNAFNEGAPSPVIRGGDAKASITDRARVMTLDQWEKKTSYESMLWGNEAFTDQLMAEHGHRLDPNANIDAVDLMNLSDVGQYAPTGGVDATDQDDNVDSGFESTSNPLHQGGAASEQLPAEELQAFRTSPALKGHKPEELVDFKRHVGGLWAQLKNIVRVFNDPTGTANGWRASFDALMHSLSVAKAAMGKWASSSLMQLIPGIGAGVALVRLGDEVVNRLRPQIALRSTQTEQLEKLRAQGVDVAHETALMTLIAESSRRIGYSMASLVTGLGVLTGQVAAVATAGWGLTVSAVSVVIGWATSAVEFFHNAWLQHKAAKSEAAHDEARDALDRAEQNLQLARDEADGSDVAYDRVVQADAELQQAKDLYQRAKHAMLADSNHAAFNEIIEKTFEPLRSGMADELSPDARELLKQYGLSSYFIVTTEMAFRSAQSRKDVTIDMDTAIDDVSGFLAVKRPQTIGDQLLGWLQGGIAGARRAAARLLGIDVPDELREADVRTMVTDRVSDRVHDAAVKAGRAAYDAPNPQLRIINDLSLISDAASRGFRSVFTELNHGHHQLAQNKGGAKVINDRYRWAENFVVEVVKRRLESYTCKGVAVTGNLIDELFDVSANMNKSLDVAVVQVEVKSGLDNPKGWKDAMTRLGLPEWIPDEEDPNQWRFDSKPGVKAAGGYGRMMGVPGERVRG
jgi:hypothetical protein